jgi:hypothetical protein
VVGRLRCARGREKRSAGQSSKCHKMCWHGVCITAHFVGNTRFRSQAAVPPTPDPDRRVHPASRCVGWDNQLQFQPCSDRLTVRCRGLTSCAHLHHLVGPPSTIKIQYPPPAITATSTCAATRRRPPVDSVALRFPDCISNAAHRYITRRFRDWTICRHSWISCPDNPRPRAAPTGQQPRGQRVRGLTQKTSRHR